MDDRDELYFVKGDNPLCIYHYPDSGLYLYASTEEILMRAIVRMPYGLGRPSQVKLECGEILKIDANGLQTRGSFNTRNLYSHWYTPYSDCVCESWFIGCPTFASERCPVYAKSEFPLRKTIRENFLLKNPSE